MPKMISPDDVRFVKTKTEVAAILEKWRAHSKKNKKEFAKLMAISAEMYNHIVRGTAYPNFVSVCLLCSHFSIEDITNLTSADIKDIKAGNYDK